MIFRQLFEPVSRTYSYLIASRRGGEALIIDPVLEKVDRYLQLMRELDLHLVKAVDTHLHADHITGLGALRDRTHCITVMGEQSSVDVVSMRIADADRLQIEGVSMDVIYTPGHQDEIARRGWAFSAREAMDLVGKADVVLIDLREESERERHGSIRGSLHAQYRELQENLGTGGLLHELAETTGKCLLFYCAFGERSAMAVQAAQHAGINTARHIQGGIDAWQKIGGRLA
jgi:rhodanese-related sulfurtransferase